MLTGARIALVVLVVALAGGSYVACSAPSGPRSLRTFDPDRMAALETDMWRAYYRKENLRLLGGLLQTLREQYRFSWAEALVTSFHLGRAATVFGNARGDYERVLPDLERAYGRIRDWMGADFDPAAVARRELAWWVARRIDGENSPENVGRLIADENALLFGVPAERVRDASTLRARAGRLRDEGGEQADWDTVSRLLHESYRELHAAVNRN